jgi:alkylation response protein AidB-like acyl-CoA dehydrogenase
VTGRRWSRGPPWRVAPHTRARAGDRPRRPAGARLRGRRRRPGRSRSASTTCKQRRAFGVLIANFQTIQHRLADNATAVEGARLLGYESAWAHDADLPTAARLATASFLFAAETAFTTASESLHFHGGYGFTLEYDIQLFFRRAKAWPLVAGDRRRLYAELAHGLSDPEQE